MIILPHALCWHVSIQIDDQTVAFANVLNLLDPVFVGDPLIQHDVAGGVQKLINSKVRTFHEHSLFIVAVGV
jgi:hypothetical protein